MVLAKFNFYRSEETNIRITEEEQEALPEMIKEAKEGRNKIVTLSGSIVDLSKVNSVTFTEMYMPKNSF